MVSDGSKCKFRYCVLFTQTLKQWEAAETIRRALPEGKGEVFYPCVELWWHGLNKTKYKALFPGYVFIRSELETAELHDLIQRNRRNILSFVKELYISERKAAGEDVPESDGADIIDLSDEEAAFFDCLLGFEFDADLDRRREEAAEEDRIYKPPAAEGEELSGGERKQLSREEREPLSGGKREQLSGEDRERAEAEAAFRRRKKRIPQKGVVQMSFGYRENGRYVIMDGPLKGHEDYIVDYKPRDQKAYLNVTVGGRMAKAGMMILGKKVWFPKDREAMDILSDGTEINCREMARVMNSGGLGAGDGKNLGGTGV